METPAPRPQRDRLVTAAATAGLILIAISTVSGPRATGPIGAVLLLVAAIPVVLMLARAAAVAFRPGLTAPGRVPS
jgi:hypothetical protein